jgi:DNA polymerase III epsilon subunit-like protein
MPPAFMNAHFFVSCILGFQDAMKAFPQTFAIVDTETTGMRPPYSRVIDIGIIRIEDGKEVERFESLVNPQTSVPRLFLK